MENWEYQNRRDGMLGRSSIPLFSDPFQILFRKIPPEIDKSLEIH